MLDRPTLRLKLELDIPDLSGGPAQKYSVSRTLRAKWSEDPHQISADILNEIKDYKGSFVGDTVFALRTIFETKGKPIEGNSQRSLQVVKWAAGMLESLLFSAISEEFHRDILEDDELPEWDGTFSRIDPVRREEIKDVDIEKVMILLAPKIKHALNVISRDAKE